MITLNLLSTYLEDLLYFDKKLDIGKIDPYMTNGLMLKGKEKIDKIGFAVSASVELFKLAKQKLCQAVIVHHSFNLPATNNYDEIFNKRISALIKNELSLFGYHFLLDAHPQIGNNVEILKTIAANPIKPYFHRGNPWGFNGSFIHPLKFAEIKKILSAFLSPRSVYYDFGPDKIANVVAVSGGGAPSASEMTNLINLKTDLFITGEVHEWNRELFREARINLIAGGHYHTEMFGIKALMTKIKSDLPQIKTEWLDLENDI